jgi:hypothetical protein
VGGANDGAEPWAVGSIALPRTNLTLMEMEFTVVEPERRETGQAMGEGEQHHELTHANSGDHYWKTEICRVFYLLLSVKTRTLSDNLICRVLEWTHTAKISHSANAPLCRVSTLGKRIHTAKVGGQPPSAVCRVWSVSTRQNGWFAECQPKTLAKVYCLPSVSLGHSVNFFLLLASNFFFRRLPTLP